MPGFIDRIVERWSPEAALRRERARAALGMIRAHYAAGTQTSRAGSWRASGADADAAAARRGRLRFIARDMIRNTPLATRAQMVIVNNVVGDGIIPKVAGASDTLKRQLQGLVEEHLDTVAIDADGRANLYGLQRLALNAVVDAGEVLIRRRRRLRRDGLPVPFQVQLLEADYIDTSREGTTTDGGYIREGIEFDAIGRRVAYWLFDDHPGAGMLRPNSLTSRRVPATEILHIYRQDRPGQRRGVTWFAPVALNLQDLADSHDAHIMRQKIAACFAGFVTTSDDVALGGAAESETARLSSVTPGRIEYLAPGDEITFPTPPSVDGFDQFTAVVLRSVAAGMGITYEALVGDLSNVNFSSARMGRMEMNRNVQSWQWLMLVPQMMQPLSAWFLEACSLALGRPVPASVKLDWVPPQPILVDPSREIAALRDEVRAGFTSRQNAIRRLGYDPERVLAEQIEDAEAADSAGLAFDSDARVAKAGQAAPQPQTNERDEDIEEDSQDGR